LLYTITALYADCYIGGSMEIKVAIAKTKKYAVSDSGDSVEIAERPNGGITAILADGQGSGKSAKVTSTMVVNKAAALIADGARDGAVARTVHDYLYATKNGKVSATLTMLSADLDTRTIVISRNTDCPTMIRNEYGVTTYDDPVPPIGVHKKMKPWTLEMDMQDGLIIVTFTDGIMNAGKKYGKTFDWEKLESILVEGDCDRADDVAESILQYALLLEQDRPGDDMAVMVMTLSDRDREPKIRRMQVSYPI
jgi:serine phosphatase RsbU (regulator of sigma subunit)